MRPIGFGCEVAACQSDTTEMVSLDGYSIHLSEIYIKSGKLRSARRSIAMLILGLGVNP
jgi:hypothetical protein